MSIHINTAIINIARVQNTGKGHTILVVALLLIFLFELACAGAKHNTYTFTLTDRLIRIVGMDPASGQLITVPTYDNNDVYCVLARVTSIEVLMPGHSGLSGEILYELVVQEAPEGGLYKEDDRFKISGAPDGTTAWINKATVVEVVFSKKAGEFVDVRPPRVP